MTTSHMPGTTCLAEGAPQTLSTGGDDPARRAGGSRGSPVVNASALARRLAAARGIDLSGVFGTGPDARISRADLRLSARTAPTAMPHPEGSALALALATVPVPAPALSLLRLRIDIQVNALLTLYARLNIDIAHLASSVAVQDLFIRALGLALIAWPNVNQRIVDGCPHISDGAEISLTVGEGSPSPVISDADRKSVSAIGREIRDLSRRARAGTLTSAERSGGTACFVDLGALGIDEVTAMPEPPQSMSLAIGKAVLRTTVDCSTERVATTMSATGVFDRRAIGTHDAAGFMKTFQEFIEQPLLLLA